MGNGLRTKILTMVLFCAGVILPLRANAATILGDFLKEKGVDVTVAATLEYYGPVDSIIIKLLEQSHTHLRYMGQKFSSQNKTLFWRSMLEQLKG